MQDQIINILYFAKGIFKNKWIITLVATLICFPAWVFVYRMPDIYNSTARVHVDTRTMLRPLLRGMAVQTDVKGLVMIMKKLMFTQQNMIKVAELAGMDVSGNDADIQSLVKDLKTKVKISGGRDEIFSIESESKNPLDAKTIVQAVLTVFSEQTQQSSISDVDSAQRFIDNQIKEYEQRLRNAERAKENFKRENIGLLPGQSGEGQFSDIQNLRQQIDVANMKVTELSSKRKVLQAQLKEALDSGNEWGLTEIFENNVVAEDPRIAQLINNKNELLLKYTPDHPKIISIEKLIETIREQNEVNSMLVPENEPEIPTAKAMANPYVQTIKIRINEVDTELATLYSRIRSFKAKLEKEDKQFNTRLAIETEMQNLNRDYDSIKKNYLGLIDRREKASMSSKIDTQVSSLKFKIIDPATLPEGPSSPKRKILYTVIIIAGFGAGVAIALLMVLIRPTFGESKQVREITQLPVLGVISAVISDAQIKKERFETLKYIGVNLILVIGYSSFIVLDIMS